MKTYLLLLLLIVGLNYPILAQPLITNPPAPPLGEFLVKTERAHQTENSGALKGDLPDPKMRARMVKFMESVPGFDKLESTPWYPGKTFNGAISRAQKKNQAK